MSLEKYKKKRKKERIKEKVEDDNKNILQRNTTSKSVSYAKYNFEKIFCLYAIETEAHCIKKEYYFEKAFCIYAVKAKTYSKKHSFEMRFVCNQSNILQKMHFLLEISLWIHLIDFEKAFYMQQLKQQHIVKKIQFRESLSHCKCTIKSTIINLRLNQFALKLQ